jgi:hypothetical protein
MPGVCPSGRSSLSGSRSASGMVRTVRSCPAFWNESRKLWWPPLPAIGGQSLRRGARGRAASPGINALRRGAPATARRAPRPQPPSGRRRPADGGARRRRRSRSRRTATGAVPRTAGGPGGPPWTVGRRSRTAVGGTTQHLSHIVSGGDATRCRTRRSHRQVLPYTGRRARRRSTDLQISSSDISSVFVLMGEQPGDKPPA